MGMCADGVVHFFAYRYADGMRDAFDWDALKSFLAVARSGRLTVAARALGVDHSTLSRRIAGLEEGLGVRLFDRHPSGYTLTSRGARLLASAEAMERAALGVAREVEEESQTVSGTVRIGAPDGFGTTFLAPRLGTLQERHPNLNIQLITRPRQFSLSQREADIAIGLARPAKGRLKARKLTDYELGLYAARAYLERHGEPSSPDDIPLHPLIGYIDEMIYAPELDYIPLIAAGLRPRLASSNLLAQYQATIAGHGLCVLPVFMACDEPRLARVLPRQVSLLRAFWLIMHEDIVDLARVRVTAEFIAEAVRGAKRMFGP